MSGCVRETEPAETENETAKSAQDHEPAKTNKTEADIENTEGEGSSPDREIEDVEDIEIVLTNYTTSKRRGKLTLTSDTKTTAEEEFEIEIEDQQSIETEITETGQYELSVTTEAGSETSFPFSIDEYDLNAGSNLIVEYDDNEIMIMMQE